MNHCSKCDAVTLAENRGDEPVWVLAIEDQRCIWESPTSMPEVDINYAAELGCYCCEDHAVLAAGDYLLQAGAKAQWSDVRPIETCACCEEDFDATQRHKVLALSVEQGSMFDLEVLGVKYVARFCNTCAAKASTQPNASAMPATPGEKT